MTDKSGHDYAAEARAALDKLRGYAAGHSDDIIGAIDKVGDFIDKRTSGRYSERIDSVQDSARRTVSATLGKPAAPAHAEPAANPFGLDDEPTWTQPPGSRGAHAVNDAQKKADRRAELQAAVAKLRQYAKEHTDDVAGLVDKVGTFVDKQTQGKYADKITQAQAAAKSQLDKLK